MIKLEEKDRKRGITLKDPTNLSPIVFRCKDCGCIIRKLEDTNSYVLMNMPKEIEKNKKNLCPFCKRLNQFKGICN